MAALAPLPDMNADCSRCAGLCCAAFAFDPKRKAIVLVAGDKSGVSQKRFYRTLIAKPDLRFSDHLESLKSAKKGK